MNGMSPLLTCFRWPCYVSSPFGQLETQHCRLETHLSFSCFRTVQLDNELGLSKADPQLGDSMDLLCSLPPTHIWSFCTYWDGNLKNELTNISNSSSSTPPCSTHLSDTVWSLPVAAFPKGSSLLGCFLINRTRGVGWYLHKPTLNFEILPWQFLALFILTGKSNQSPAWLYALRMARWRKEPDRFKCNNDADIWIKNTQFLLHLALMVERLGCKQKVITEEVKL